MHKLRTVITILMILVLTISIAPTKIWADCKSDCRDEYRSAIEACQSQYDDPDDADTLISCIDDAEDGYEYCIEDCFKESDNYH
ncbi:MAG: hypothetical protein ACLP9S_15585 [Syntrophales bacterium]